MKPHKVCVVTGSRAEYGHLYPVLREIASSDKLTLQLVVTGAHLDRGSGEGTEKEIKADGFDIAFRVEMLLLDDSSTAAIRAAGSGLASLAEVYEKLRPDITVILGDRYEMLAVAQASTLARVPIAHIHGGEATEGAIDDNIRHALTKLSHIHFAATEHYAQRIRQMGELPDRVYNVGAPGLGYIDKEEGIPDGDAVLVDMKVPGLHTAPIFLVTYHPVTLDPGVTALETAALLDALAQFPDSRTIFTGVNTDMGHDHVSQQIHVFVDRHRNRSIYHASLGRLRYYALLRKASAVIGNSSSGIIEAPFIGVPTVDIGVRQKGRMKAPSVYTVEDVGVQTIVSGIKWALSADGCQIAAKRESLYGHGDAAVAIRRILEKMSLDDLLKKPFVDWPVN
jgi:UDP-N-acetylglucosamine 2-epimerase (non-hydrolysing)